jgi:hypothetical protein
MLLVSPCVGGLEIEPTPLAFSVVLCTESTVMGKLPQDLHSASPSRSICAPGSQCLPPARCPKGREITSQTRGGS